MSTVNYRWWSGGNGSGGIYETAEQVGSHEHVFSTFTGARTALAAYFGKQAQEWADARYFALRMRKGDIKEGEISL